MNIHSPRTLWKWMAATVLVHLLVSMIHGAAHAGASVPMSQAANLFVFVVILAGPLIGLGISFRTKLYGGVVVALTHGRRAGLWRRQPLPDRQSRPHQPYRDTVEHPVRDDCRAAHDYGAARSGLRPASRPHGANGPHRLTSTRARLLLRHSHHGDHHAPLHRHGLNHDGVFSAARANDGPAARRPDCGTEDDVAHEMPIIDEP